VSYDLTADDVKLIVVALDWYYNVVPDAGAPDYEPTQRHYDIEDLRRRLTTGGRP
jgi:hypothetical protein